MTRHLSPVSVRLFVLLAGVTPAFGQAAPMSAPATPPAASSAGNDLEAQRLREDMRKVVIEARDKVFPALVNISVITVSYTTGQENKGATIETSIDPKIQQAAYNGQHTLGIAQQGRDG